MTPSPDFAPQPSEPAKESWESPALTVLDVEETLGGANVVQPESTSGLLS